MPKSLPLSREEKLERREKIAIKARSGQLRFPHAVKEIRQSLGLTQQEFGDRFGLARIHVIALEKGKSNPTLETLEKIGKPFGFAVGFVPKGEI